MNRSLARLAPVGLALLGFFACACDPVHSDEIAALGGETPGVPKGPLHRPGQPCVLCHDGSTAPAFSVAGTVYETASTGEGVNGITVTLTDSTGSTMSAISNAAGNFYLTPGEWTPAYPIPSTMLQSGSATTLMYSEIGRNGSCAGCHTNPAGPSSPGHVSVVPP